MACTPEVLESRVVLAEDFGDAPDTGPGTGRGNYQTLLSDDGPRHTRSADLRFAFGTPPSTEADGKPSASANLDDDLTGVRDPETQLRLTVGSQPRIALYAQNLLTTTARVYGWIDYNADGVFDNGTERAQVDIPSTAANPSAFSVYTLTFPVVPSGFTGTTYARFRLSSDTAASSPTGLASDGEVQDHLVTISPLGAGTAKSNTRVDVPNLLDESRFGQSLANLGDLDGDGIEDLAVGAHGDSTVGGARGAVHILFMNADQTVKSETKLTSGRNGAPDLNDGDFFGFSVANIGDFDKDGIVDIAVGAPGDDTGVTDGGAFYVMTLNRDGTVKGFAKIDRTQLIFTAASDNVGASLTSLGDIDGDGVGDLAVGVPGSDYRGTDRGGLNVVFLNANGTVKSFRGLSSGSGGAPDLNNGDQFGSELAFLGFDGTDADGNPLFKLAVGAPRDNTGGVGRGAVHILNLKRDGTVDSDFSRKLASGMNGVPVLADGVQFGVGLADFGRVGGNRVLAVGSDGDSVAGPNRGAVYLLTLDGANRVATNGVRKFSSGFGLPTLGDRDYLGGAIASLRDVDGDGIRELAIGAQNDDTGGTNRGTVHILRLSASLVVKDGGASKIVSGVSGMPDGSRFGTSTVSLGDIDGDGVEDLAVGSQQENSGRGAVRVLLMHRSGGVKSTQVLGGTLGLNVNDRFGTSLARLRDVDGDGVPELAVGAPFDDTNGADRGAVYLLRLNSNGTLKASIKLASGVSNMPALANNDRFGASLSAFDDFGTFGGLVVGATGDNNFSGAIYTFSFVNFFSPSVNGVTKIASGVSGGPTLVGNAGFGSSIANLGDVDGDGFGDLAVGAYTDGGPGAVHILFLNGGRQVRSSTRIGNGTNGGPALVGSPNFGISAAPLGDIDGDGVPDVAVGAQSDTTGGSNRGAVYVLRLQRNGAAKSVTTIASGLGGAPQLADNSYFGRSIAALGDINGDGVRDLAVGARGGAALSTRGTVHLLRLNAATNSAPALDNSGNPFAVLGVGSRQSTEMRQGTLVSDILARGANNGNLIFDPDAGTQLGIAITATDNRFGTFQYSLTTTNPPENSWVDFGAVSDTSALLLPTTARVRFTTSLIPHHATAAPFLPLESKLDAGLTFRAWDQSSGAIGAKADTSANGGATAFSIATETAKVYFEARLFRSFNTVAALNIYTLEAEFNALTANPAIVDRSTSGFTGFTILMSAVPELGTAPLYRSYFGVQFNGDGTETDMGYRYLTTDINEAAGLENLGPANKRPSREGAYFRELGVNAGTAILGYIYATQQPGTAQMTQVYRTDNVGKPTRPPGTVEGGTPTSTRPQEQGDHVYTTNTAFETSRPGTWRVEANRGFVRELTPSPTGVGPALAAEPLAVVASGSNSGLAVPRALPAVEASPVVVASPQQGDVFKLVATGNGVVPTAGTGSGAGAGTIVEEPGAIEMDADDSFEAPSAGWCDDAFADLDLVAACGLGV